MRDLVRLLQYARRQRAAWALISVLTVAGAGLAALQPWPMKLLVDHVLGQAALPPLLERVLDFLFPNHSAGVLVGVIVVGGLALFALNSTVEAGLTWAWTAAGRRMVYDLSEDLFARLQRRSLVFHKRNAVGDLLSRVTGDCWCVYHVVDTLVFAPGHALLTTLVMVALMAQLDGALTVLTVALAPAIVGASFLLGKPLRAAATSKREIESSIQAHVQQTLTGLPVVQAFAQEDAGTRRFQSLAEAAIRSQQHGALLGSINGLTSGLVVTLGSGLVLWVGARHVLTGTLSLGSLWVFLSYLGSLQAQVKVLAGLYTALQGFSANVRRVVQVLDSPPEITEKPQVLELPSARGQVRFDQVTVGYEPGRPILKEITLEARPGETLAIVGATGAGKSTLVSLIPRLLDPWEGRVLMGGEDVRELRLDQVRRQVGMVLQESFLFPVSIRENIGYGRSGVSEPEIVEAARAANAHEFIQGLPDRYDTVIGERGATLSGGERQRLSIARALLKNPPILILDEPTSALDAETEQSILDALERLMRGRTTFIIAHRLSTVRRADRILVLHEGRIVERGAHEELLARNGVYARLHRLQTTAAGNAVVTKS